MTFRNISGSYPTPMLKDYSSWDVCYAGPHIRGYLPHLEISLLPSNSRTCHDLMNMDSNTKRELYLSLTSFAHSKLLHVVSGHTSAVNTVMEKLSYANYLRAHIRCVQIL